jgi:fatty acid desaturase
MAIGEDKQRRGLQRTQHARVLPWFAETVRVGNLYSFTQKKPWVHNVIKWTVPVAIFLGFQVLDILNECKIAFEHGGRAMVQENQHLRSTTSIFPLRRLLMPFNISLHFEHHINFNVPWYSLMAYHKALQAVLPEDVKHDVFKYGIAALLTLLHEDMRERVLESRLKG